MSDMQFTFRETGPADLTYIKRLNYLADVFGDETVNPDPEQFLDANRFYLDAWTPERGGVLVSDHLGVPAGASWLIWGTEELHGAGYVAPDIPELAIAVEKRYARRGLGGQLIERVADLAKELGAPGLSLCVHEDNVAAKALYERRRFEFHGQEGDSPYIAMVRRFPDAE